jgi:hypothetical protein
LRKFIKKIVVKKRNENLPKKKTPLMKGKFHCNGQIPIFEVRYKYTIHFLQVLYILQRPAQPMMGSKA